MRTFLWVVVALDQLAILLIGAVKLEKFQLSEFQFRSKLAEQSGQSARQLRSLHKNLPPIKSFQLVELCILGVVLTALLTSLIAPPALGAIYTLLSFLVIALLAKLSIIQNIAEKLFQRSLDFLIKTTTFLAPFLKLLGSYKTPSANQPASYEEFSDLVRRLPSTVLTPTQRQHLEAILSSEAKTVKDIMTTKKRVVTVEPSATLGPIVLSDLQKTGHGYFPVATKKGEPEGILTLSDLMDLEVAKQRSTVRELMSAHLAWVEEDTPLIELARAILEEKQYVVLVRNEDGDFSGLVTISDLMKHLVGITKSD